MESPGELVPFPLVMTSNYRAGTIPYRFPSDDSTKPTPTELSWIQVFMNSIPSFRERAESDDTVPDAPSRAEMFSHRYAEILEDLKKDPESHGGPPDGIVKSKCLGNWDSEIYLKRLSYFLTGDRQRAQPPATTPQ
uniref:Uncharacterized protein At2g17340-like n=1 Tax=Nicotiana sylvestris TaxID=4096 RepID=A0A1U7WVK5_NICSY